MSKYIRVMGKYIIDFEKLRECCFFSKMDIDDNMFICDDSDNTSGICDEKNCPAVKGACKVVMKGLEQFMEARQ